MIVGLTRKSNAEAVTKNSQWSLISVWWMQFHLHGGT